MLILTHGELVTGTWPRDDVELARVVCGAGPVPNDRDEGDVAVGGEDRLYVGGGSGVLDLGRSEVGES